MRLEVASKTRWVKKGRNASALRMTAVRCIDPAEPEKRKSCEQAQEVLKQSDRRGRTIKGRGRRRSRKGAGAKYPNSNFRRWTRVLAKKERAEATEK